MKNSIKTLSMSSALIAFTIGIAMAQGSTPTPAATPAPAKTEATPAAKAEAKVAAKEEAKESAKTEAKENATAAKASAPKWTADQIKAAQAGLAKGGYYKGMATGKWDKASKNALKAWQKANKMKATGKLTEDTMDKLKAS